MEVQITSASSAALVLLSREPLFGLMEASVRDMAAVRTIFTVYPKICLETVVKVADCLLGLLRVKEVFSAALELLLLARLTSDYAIRIEGRFLNHQDWLAKHDFNAADSRFAKELSAPLEDAILENKALAKDEMDTLDQSKACASEMLPNGPVQESDNVSGACSSEWIVCAAKDKDEANNNHAKADKAFTGGKKSQQPEDEEDDEDDDDDEAEGGDEDDEDDGEESEEDGNGGEDEEEEEDDEDEEEEDEDEEEGAPVPAQARRVENVEDDSDGEDEEEGVEDEDDFEDGEDEDGEDEDEDEEEEEEDVPEPPKKKSKP